MEDFLTFVAENDGRNFKQGSRMNETNRVITPEMFYIHKQKFEKEISRLEERISRLEKHNLDMQAERDGWQKDELGEYRLPPPVD